MDTKEIVKPKTITCKSCHHTYVPEDIKYHTCTPCVNCRVFGAVICKSQRPMFSFIFVKR